MVMETIAHPKLAWDCRDHLGFADAGCHLDLRRRPTEDRFEAVLWIAKKGVRIPVSGFLHVGQPRSTVETVLMPGRDEQLFSHQALEECRSFLAYKMRSGLGCLPTAVLGGSVV